MFSRFSLPLSSRPAFSAQPAALFGSAELSQRLGLTARQLQWWDEQGILPAQHEGHKRLYGWREAMLAGVIRQLRQAGLGSARLQTALRTINRPRQDEFPAYFVVNWTSGESYAAANDQQALGMVCRFGEKGVPSLVIDLAQIEHQLATPSSV